VDNVYNLFKQCQLAFFFNSEDILNFKNYRFVIAFSNLFLVFLVNYFLSDCQGWTALHCSVSGGDEECVELLLQHDATLVDTTTLNGVSMIVFEH